MSTPSPKQFYRRILPETCVSFASERGKQLFTEALKEDCLGGYFVLAAQFRTQDEPAFCGLSTLVMVLNALEVDPKRVWKGPWRWYHEDMLDCCVPLEVIKQKGITLEQFRCLAMCNTLNARMVRATDKVTLDDFRQVVKCISQQDTQILIGSYSRKIIGQTGDGHFSPIAGYHPGEDMVLILDTARFKYPPHWLSLPLLYDAMQAHDKDTDQPRGYVILEKSQNHPLVLFRISDHLNITTGINHHTNQATFKVIQEYIQSLQTEKQLDDVITKTVDKLFEVLQKLSKDEFILSTQIDLEKASQLSGEHSCIIKHMMESLEGTPIFQQISAVLDTRKAEAGFNSIICKVGKPSPTILTSCCKQSNQCENVLNSLNSKHFLAVLLLSIPLDATLSVFGSSLQEVLDRSVELAGDVLKNEFNMLRKQLETVLGYIKRCNSCGCNC